MNDPLNTNIVFYLKPVTTVRHTHYGQNAGLGPLRSGYDARPTMPQTRVLILIDRWILTLIARCTKLTRYAEAKPWTQSLTAELEREPCARLWLLRGL